MFNSITALQKTEMARHTVRRGMVIEGVVAVLGSRAQSPHHLKGAAMPWQAVDAETGRAVSHFGWAPRFPKLALRKAFRHRAASDVLCLGAGKTWVEFVCGRNAWDVILVVYKCVESVTTQGSGATIRKTYMPLNGSVHYLHTRIIKEHGGVEFTAREFMMFPPAA